LPPTDYLSAKIDKVIVRLISAAGCFQQHIVFAKKAVETSGNFIRNIDAKLLFGKLLISFINL